MRSAHALALAVLVVLPACAARTSARPSFDYPAAEAELRAGCYTCLREGRERYEQALTREPGSMDAAAGAFAAALLVGLREKELGLDSGQAISRARELTTRQADAALAATLVDFGEQVRGELAGIDPEERTERLRLRRGPPPRLDTILLARPTPTPVSLSLRYLWLTLECEHPEARRALDAAHALARLGDSPLFRFRLALCASDDAAPFQALRTADPRWTETSFFEGRLLLGDPQTLAPGITTLRLAHDRLKDSPAVTMTLADAERSAREHDTALAHYDEVLAASPTHRDALLGRAFALTRLEREAEGIDAATRLIDLGTWHQADAHYLRAWNEYRLKRLDEAWVDIERATALRSSTEVFMLAGLVAYARQDLDAARARFGRAYELDGTNCTAERYLGLVHAEQQSWRVAAPIFSTAFTCFSAAATKARAELAEIEAADTAADFKAREAAARREIVEESELEGARSAFNAAQAYARIGLRQQALEHLPAALAHDALRESAEKLRLLLQ